MLGCRTGCAFLNQRLPSRSDRTSAMANGPSEQRTGWVLEDVITMLNELCDECLALGWDVF